MSRKAAGDVQSVFRCALKKTAKMAKVRDTGSLPPHLPSARIKLSADFAIGKELEAKYGIEFLDMDFKKKAGFQWSIQLSKEYGLYRQNYCGCEFSKR